MFTKFTETKKNNKQKKENKITKQHQRMFMFPIHVISVQKK